jgi:hypothetical protein
MTRGMQMSLQFGAIPDLSEEFINEAIPTPPQFGTSSRIVDADIVPSIQIRPPPPRFANAYVFE